MLTTIAELRQWSHEQHSSGKRIAVVPTMGALHEGHLSLVRAANQRGEATLVTIFVNPTQFGPNEDFKRYPRTLENDLELLKAVGSPEIFAPPVDEMYPAGFGTAVHVGTVTEPFEGRSRPTHFDGVATVVLKLFLASGADLAFFGQKDFQQACVIRKMVVDLNVPVEIVVCPIIREPDGLAMSSRNRYLSPEQRRQAIVLSQSLAGAERLIVGQNVRDVDRILTAMRETIAAAPDMTIDYLAVADPVTLRELTKIDIPEVVVLLATKIGATRLIDNRLIRGQEPGAGD